MSVDTAPPHPSSAPTPVPARDPIDDIIALAMGTLPAPPPGQQTALSGKPPEVEVRIHKDGLLIARCHASGIAPGRLFVEIDPLNYPLNSHLTLAFVNPADRSTNSAGLAGTVISRTTRGIELRLDPPTP